MADCQLPMRIFVYSHFEILKSQNELQKMISALLLWQSCLTLSCSVQLQQLFLLSLKIFRCCKLSSQRFRHRHSVLKQKYFSYPEVYRKDNSPKSQRYFWVCRMNLYFFYSSIFSDVF